MKVVVTALTLVVVAFCGLAQADVGVMSTSRQAAAPGDTVKVTLGCGFCFPPCEGPKGERHPAGFDHGPCMLGTHGTPPPESFGLSLVPLAKAPKPHRCGPNALCPPTRSGPPSPARANAPIRLTCDAPLVRNQVRRACQARAASS